MKSILKHCSEHNILTDAQHGFREKRSCETQLVTLVHDLATGMAGGGQVDMILLDFSKAFDKVPHQSLLHKLNGYGIGGKHLTWIRNFLSERHQRVVVEGCESSYAEVISGVPQGTVLGPVLFLLFINDLPSVVKHSHVRLFADDAAIYLPINSRKDARLLQEDLNNLTEWEARWQMSFHPDKCKTMRFSRATDKIELTYKLRGHPLEVVNSEKYLGVKLDDKLSWGPQVNTVTGKAKGKLGFLQRNLKIKNPSIKETAFKSLVRSTLEYSCTAWDPHIQDQVDDLEKVQRRGARYVTNRYSYEDSPSEMCHRLKWEPLQHRRAKAKLTMTYKVLHGEVAIPPYKYFTARPPPARFTRRAAAICEHSLGLMESDSTTDYERNSFFHSVPPVWNALPACMAEAVSLSSFKSQMTRQPLQRLLPGHFPASSQAT